MNAHWVLNEIDYFFPFEKFYNIKLCNVVERAKLQIISNALAVPHLSDRYSKAKMKKKNRKIENAVWNLIGDSEVN